MCGISAIFGSGWTQEQLKSMHAVQRHRGPDADGFYIDPRGICGMAHNRLSIIDLSDAGRQPLATPDGRFRILLNGEIYNFIELRQELKNEFEFRTATDTEVLLAAFQKWGKNCLNRLIGMFAFVIWDDREKIAFAARDRFGVKPFYYHRAASGSLYIASEIKALHAAGVGREVNHKTWGVYLTYGATDISCDTFWRNISSLPAGHYLTWKNGSTDVRRWYELAESVGPAFDANEESTVADEYLGLMKESVEMRFRSDVAVGINLSGGLDSSTLLAVVRTAQERGDSVKAFTFVTGDERYDELPWVREMIRNTGHELVVSELSAVDVPALAESVQRFQDEPFGGIPTLAYAKLFETARGNGIKVLLDGNGMDEQWGGYDYYRLTSAAADGPVPVVQGVTGSPLRPDCLTGEFRNFADRPVFPDVFPDRFRNLQYRDTVYTKIPRAMRFNDRISMRASTELREPFLDHRLVELALRQPENRKRVNGTGKKMLRDITKRMLPNGVSEAPKRPIQTPQREWLRGELREWADDVIKTGLTHLGRDWFKRDAVLDAWDNYCKEGDDNSFYVWQWITVGLMSNT